MMVGSETAGLIPNPTVIAQQAGSEVILVNMATNIFFELNSTGSRFWELLQAGNDLAEIQTAMSAEFEVEPEELSAEIDKLVGELVEQGLCLATTPAQEAADGEPAPNSTVIARRVGDETVLVNMSSNVFFELNGTGSRFWELLAQGHDRAEISKRMSQEFEVEPGQLREEIDELVVELVEQGLVTCRPLEGTS